MFECSIAVAVIVLAVIVVALIIIYYLLLDQNDVFFNNMLFSSAQVYLSIAKSTLSFIYQIKGTVGVRKTIFLIIKSCYLL